MGEQERPIRQEDTSLRMSMNMGVTSVDPGPPFRRSDKTRIAVLCKHNLARPELGDTVNTYDKIIALAKGAPVILFTPRGYVSKDLYSLMRIIQVSPPGLRFTLTLLPALLLHMRDYDCIYCRDPLLMALAVPMKIFGKMLAIELHGIPSIETEVRRQTYKVRAPRLTPLICGSIRLIETLAIRSAHITMPVTETMRNTLLKDYCADARKVTVLPNSVDTTLFKPLETERTEIRHKHGIEKGTVILYLSTFSTRWRGTSQLFHVADLVQRKRSDITFLIVGSGPLLEEAKAGRAGRETHSRFVFVGTVGQHLVPQYMSAADVYVYDVTDVSNKLIEKQGLCPAKILQALSCGKPVIAPKAPDLELILQNSGGGFSTSSMEEIQVYIEKFADSAELVKSMGANARRYIEKNHDLARLTRRKIELMSNVSFQERRDS